MVSETGGDHVEVGFFEVCRRQSGVYRRSDDNGVLIIVLVHADDCTIVGKSKVLVEWFKTEIAKFADITDLGDLHWILEIEVRQIHED